MTTKKRTFIHAMTRRAFACIACADQISDYSKRINKKSDFSAEKKESMIAAFMDNLIESVTSGFVSKHAKFVCNYLNDANAYILPVTGVVIEE